MILNAGDPPNISSEQPIDIALTLAMADLKAHFIEAEKSRVQYRAIKGSEAFEKYKNISRGLQSFDLRSLREREEKLAFWINIYNTAVIHGVIELGLGRSVKEFPRFFDRITYTIGTDGFSLNDIEHGILRGNRRPPYRFWSPFREKDPRFVFAITPLDPRIHFALVCGARSCPPIGFYEAGQIDFQLQLAAMSFINSPQVKILPDKATVLISRIFKWYKTDFGGSHPALIDFLLNYLDQGENKTFLQ
ncbi:MAG: hypothetical protein A2169_09130, partial [Deltaproteobacteria bacterium RBG_13_47_9]